jgi:hypothetical protein
VLLGALFQERVSNFTVYMLLLQTRPRRQRAAWCPFSRARQQFYSLHAAAAERNDY